MAWCEKAINVHLLQSNVAKNEMFYLLQVEYKDFPKNNKNEFVSLINCSSQPPLISHGIGKDVESCHDMVSFYSSLALLHISFLSIV